MKKVKKVGLFAGVFFVQLTLVCTITLLLHNNLTVGALGVFALVLFIVDLLLLFAIWVYKIAKRPDAWYEKNKEWDD